MYIITIHVITTDRHNNSHGIVFDLQFCNFIWNFLFVIHTFWLQIASRFDVDWQIADDHKHMYIYMILAVRFEMA